MSYNYLGNDPNRGYPYPGYGQATPGYYPPPPPPPPPPGYVAPFSNIPPGGNIPPVSNVPNPTFNYTPIE
jgi:cytokinesis protein